MSESFNVRQFHHEIVALGDGPSGSTSFCTSVALRSLPHRL
ncbi:MAG: hypothetical protein VB125_02690 [Burkholderia sp.]